MAELRLKQTGTIQLFENDNTSKITIASPASLTTDRTITLPDADVTLASGTMLAADGSGASLTALNATEITSGTIPDDARLPTVGVDKGGTNLTSFATGDIVYASGATTISKLAKPGTPDGEVLTFAACASAPSWAAAASGISWQSVQTSTPFTAVAGNGYPINTTSSAITMNLPAGVVGEQVALVDYAGTFDTNALTINPNGSEKFQGAVASAIMDTERQGAILTYVDATQGWVITTGYEEGATQPAFIVATGGTITTDGDYKVHSFLADGTFEVTQIGSGGGSTTIDWVNVGGGGGGGSYGGGGAGGHRQNYPNPITGGTPVSVTTYPITVGAGGAGKISGCGVGVSGTPSTAFSITSTAGGFGGSSPAGGPGGSGGGGGWCSGGGGGTGNTPPAPVSQGNPGGAGSGGTPVGQYVGGGGGGHAAAGGDAGSNPPGSSGPGGNGTATTITGASVTRAGGGGGGTYGQPWTVAASAGGTGGGGNGGHPSQPGPTTTAGTANTGGGGGGSGEKGTPSNSGGSGVVIVRYKFQ